jgi:hypothetical protein
MFCPAHVMLGACCCLLCHEGFSKMTSFRAARGFVIAGKSALAGSLRTIKQSTQQGILIKKILNVSAPTARHHAARESAARHGGNARCADGGPTCDSCVKQTASSARKYCYFMRTYASCLHQLLRVSHPGTGKHRALLRLHPWPCPDVRCALLW